jgi:hypothetical protein
MSSLLSRNERGLPGAGSLRHCLSGPVSPTTPTPTIHRSVLGTHTSEMSDEYVWHLEFSEIAVLCTAAHRRAVGERVMSPLRDRFRSANIAIGRPP